jgi:phosphomannomutase
LILNVSVAFSKYLNKGSVVIGRDSRPTGDAIIRGVEFGLSMSGSDVINLGIVPTPTVQIMVEKLNAAGGIVVSASHNPIEWNAFKLINSNGTFLNSKEIKKFFKFMDSEFKYEKWNNIGEIIEDKTAEDYHIKMVLSVVNKKKIRNKKYKVVLDSVNGAGSFITQKLLEELGCEVVPLYCDGSGIFPRVAEPLPENLGALSKAVIKHKADIGFAQDPDADRLAIVNEKGKPIGEEYTIVLVSEYLLKKKKGRVVVNLSTTKAVEDVAKRYDVPFKRSKVGEINVVDEMRKSPSRIGGEGNGGVISPELHLGRDSLAGIVYILQLMQERGKSVSELIADLPFYVMKKGKVKIKVKDADIKAIEKIKEEFKKEKLSKIDGLRIDFVKESKFKGGSVHLRSSNTEPMFRIISEGIDEKQADDIYRYFYKMF